MPHKVEVAAVTHSHSHGEDAEPAARDLMLWLSVIGGVLVVCSVVATYLLMTVAPENHDHLHRHINSFPATVISVDEPTSTMLAEKGDGSHVQASLSRPWTEGREWSPGDGIIVNEITNGNGDVTFDVASPDRTIPIILVLAVAALALIGVARWKGLRAMLAIIPAGLLLWLFALPVLSGGASVWLVLLCVVGIVQPVLIFMVHGLSAKSVAAILGTWLSVLVASGAGWLALRIMDVNAVGTDLAEVSSSATNSLLLFGIVLGGLGLTNDISIAQASVAMEMRQHLSITAATRRAMAVGADHIASTVYTVVFAYAGVALATLLSLSMTGMSILGVLSYDDVAVEIVRVCVGIVIVAIVVPLVTWVSAVLTKSPP